MQNSKQYLLIKERFPHIADRLDLCWGNYEFTVYVYRLLDDTRDGTRKGFPAEVFFALLDIIAMHDAQYPRFAKKFLDIWESNNGR